MEFLVVLKRDCETCKLVEPVLAALRDEFPLTLYSQDDPSFPEGLGGSEDDRTLEKSYHLGVETVPPWCAWKVERKFHEPKAGIGRIGSVSLVCHRLARICHPFNRDADLNLWIPACLRD